MLSFFTNIFQYFNWFTDSQSGRRKSGLPSRCIGFTTPSSVEKTNLRMISTLITEVIFFFRKNFKLVSTLIFPGQICRKHKKQEKEKHDLRRLQRSCNSAAEKHQVEDNERCLCNSSSIYLALYISTEDTDLFRTIKHYCTHHVPHSP